MTLKKSAVALASFVMAGCTQVGVDIANLPAKLSNTERVTQVTYGDQANQSLDIYIPEKAAADNQRPVLVFFYGGRWTDGNKEMYQFVGETFAQQGYVVVIPDYRKYPEVKFPTFVEDGAQAVAWTFNNIQSYFGNTDKLFLMGHSAGAHIAGLVTAAPEYLNAHQLEPDIIDAFAGLAGPYDFVPEEDDLIDMFGPEEQFPEITVTHYIQGDEPPMLLLWGEDDELVGRRNMDLLSQEIKAKGGKVETKTYPDTGHVDMVSSLVWFLPTKAPIVQDVSEFFNQFQ